MTVDNHMNHHARNIKPLPPRQHFYRRLFRSMWIAAIVIVAALGIGMAGYGGFEGLSLVDSFLNASMILSGMGPANELHTVGGKIFAGCYAIFSGIIFIAMAGLMFGPVLHRFLHRFHLELEPEGEKKS